MEIISSRIIIVIFLTLLVIFFSALVIFFLLEFLGFGAGGLRENTYHLFIVFLILLLELLLGFIYKRLTKSGLFLKIAIGLIILLVVYLAISGIISLTNFCPPSFNFMPVGFIEFSEEPFLKQFFCPFSGRVY